MRKIYHRYIINLVLRWVNNHLNKLLQRQRARSEQKEREDLVTFQREREEKLKWKEAQKFEDLVLADDQNCEAFSCVDSTIRRISPAAFNFKRRRSMCSACREWSAVDQTTVGGFFIF